MHRLVIFGNSSSRVCRRLTEATVAALRARTDIQCVAFVEAATGRPRPKWIRRVARFAKLIFDPDGEPAGQFPEPPDVARSLRGWNGRWIVPAGRDINHPAFLRILREEIRPTLAFSFGCAQIFRKELLAECRVMVNYHNALLPKYRGLRATSWALYHGETQTGLTFHYVDEEIDTGAILLQQAISLRPDRSVLQLDHQACELAAENMGAVLELMIRGDRGKPQTGVPSYFGMKALQDIRHIEEVSAFSFDELQRRLRAFHWLNLRINGRFCEATRLEQTTGSKRGPSLMTSDGVAVRATRFYFMPRPLYELYRVLRRQAPL